MICLSLFSSCLHFVMSLVIVTKPAVWAEESRQTLIKMSIFLIISYQGNGETSIKGIIRKSNDLCIMRQNYHSYFVDISDAGLYSILKSTEKGGCSLSLVSCPFNKSNNGISPLAQMKDLGPLLRMVLDPIEKAHAGNKLYFLNQRNIINTLFKNKLLYLIS